MYQVTKAPPGRFHPLEIAMMADLVELGREYPVGPGDAGAGLSLEVSIIANGLYVGDQGVQREPDRPDLLPAPGARGLDDLIEQTRAGLALGLGMRRGVRSRAFTRG